MKCLSLRSAPALMMVLLLGSSVISVLPVTLDELQADSNLTPERFASYFTDFEFQLREKVQSPERFLASKNGDCDDYATLAADILRAKGYTPRLVVVYMPKATHVVCYVAESKSYLDFNNRNQRTRTVTSDGRLEDIADQVAQSFNASWHCVSEFTFKNGLRRMVYTDFPQGRPQVGPVPAESKSAAKAVIVNGN